MLNPYNKDDKKILTLLEKVGYKVENSGMNHVFLKQALRSAHRSKEAGNKGMFEEELGESSSAIIYSALSTEVIISEFITHFDFTSSEIPEPLVKLRETLDPMDKWKTLLKFRKPDIDIGSNSLFQKLNCLMDLRNAIAHRHSRLLEPNMYPDKIETCIRLKIINKPKEFRGSWIASMLNYETAQWAVEIASEWLDFSSEFVSVNEADI